MTTNWLEILRHYPEITGIHPAADLFPMVEGDEFRELCADIKERGLAQPITIWTDGSRYLMVAIAFLLAMKPTKKLY
jgi:hypothetical protein